MMRLYSGCGTRRMTSTTMVLAILDDTTEPTFSFLLGVVSAIRCYRPFLLVIAAFFWTAVFAAAFFGAAFFAVLGAAFLAPDFAATLGVAAGLVLVTSGTGAADPAERAKPF